MCGFYNETYGEVSLDIDKKLRTLNKPALETIKSEDGDVIDCIDIYKQHAFDHPALRNHKIQMKPSAEFDAKTTTIPNNGSDDCGSRVQLSWRSIRYKHLEPSGSSGWGLQFCSDLANRWHFKFIFESIEAGWMVNPSVFGDSRTRLFAYWTKDAYTKTGCINLLCSGFVQTTTKFALGAAIEPVSRARGDQYYMAFSMYLDPNSGNWWLTCGNNVMGYWPGTLFSGLKHSATAVQWGGEVYSPNGIMKKPHTRTPMGSGNWASSLWSRACFHTNLRIKDFSLQVKYPQYLGEYVDEHNCYSTKLHRDTYKAEPRFYFGGPGQNPLCP
ncbi:hypothetical protein YC2023_025740 [Brassica napus]